MGFANKMAAMALACALAACTQSNAELQEKTDRFAKRAAFTPLQIKAEPFIIKAYEHITDQTAPIRVFIEGDGKAWLTRSQPSPDPTPYSPTALFIAATDNSPNVAYLARPCQYFLTANCTMAVWTSQQYNETNIAAMNTALDHWKGHKLELVGYSGGATIALLLAARRSDVINIRTISGNLDTVAFAKHHGVSLPPANALNPADFVTKTASIPQIHFAGQEDHIVPPELARTYQAKLPAGNCSKVIAVQNTDHIDGWTEHWPKLKDRLLPCTQPSAAYK